MESMVHSFLDWFLRSSIWRWFASKYMAHFTFRVMGYPEFPMGHYFSITDLAKSGDFYAFVSSDYQSLASLAIRGLTSGSKPALWSHAGLILFNGIRDTKELHMKGNGVNHETLLRTLREADYFAVIRIPLEAGGVEKVKDKIKWVLENRDRIKYDYAQDLGNSPDILYCSELVHFIFSGFTAEPIKTKTILGREAFDPDSVFEMGEIVYCNHPNHKVIPWEDTP